MHFNGLGERIRRQTGIVRKIYGKPAPGRGCRNDRSTPADHDGARSFGRRPDGLEPMVATTSAICTPPAVAGGCCLQLGAGRSRPGTVWTSTSTSTGPTPVAADPAVEVRPPPGGGGTPLGLASISKPRFGTRAIFGRYRVLVEYRQPIGYVAERMRTPPPKRACWHALHLRGEVQQRSRLGRADELRSGCANCSAPARSRPTACA
jgi:hypothetical protein